MGAEQIAEDVVSRLEKAWNAADGSAYGEAFTADADFVAIRGDAHSGAEAIGAGHQHIFDTIYRGSTIRCEVVRARKLDDHVILAQVKSTMTAPSGPLAGEHAAMATVVLVPEGDDWRVAAFHNTLITG
jgi:uncharacterized protein (TIGR02246 family)